MAGHSEAVLDSILIAPFQGATIQIRLRVPLPSLA
jgi:hypothetical protein